jgi:Replicative DNA helicase
MAELLHRIPPHNLEAEQSVLGSMLIDAEAVSVAAGSLKAEDFYSEAHKEIFEAMLNLYDRGEPVDLVTGCGRIEAEGYPGRSGWCGLYIRPVSCRSQHG